MFESFTLMFQREVAERIVATPASPKDYGRLGVLCGWRTAGADPVRRLAFGFHTAAEGDFDVVQLTPRPEPLPCRTEDLDRRCASRLRTAPKNAAAEPEAARRRRAALLAAAGLDPTARAETIPVEGFVALANAWRSMRAAG